MRVPGVRFAALGAVALVVTLPSACKTHRDLPACEDPATHARDAGNAGDPVFVGAGDIALCSDLRGAEATAQLLDRIPGTVYTVGDNAYEYGSLSDFNDCYGSTWGRHRARTWPAVGNHEYETANAGPYFAYFCGAAGEPFRGYYSYDLGAWHMVVLNSNCDNVDCAAGSAQERWLRDDLAAHPAKCTLAYWHHPRFTAGHHANATNMQPLWQALQDHGAEIALTGHSHGYERFAPQTPDGAADPNGIREFVVGTGGADLGAFTSVQPNAEARVSGVWGVLKLTLHPASYEWQFIPVEGQTFSDTGKGDCH